MDQLLGRDVAGVAASYTGNIYYCRTQAVLSGILDHFWVYGTAAGNVRIGVYDEVSTLPANLLGQSISTPVTSSTGWKKVVIPRITIKAGVYYWVGAQSDANNGFTTYSHAGDQYQVQAYGAFPSTATPSANAWGADFGGYGLLLKSFLIARRDRFRTTGISLG